MGLFASNVAHLAQARGNLLELAVHAMADVENIRSENCASSITDFFSDRFDRAPQPACERINLPPIDEATLTAPLSRPHAHTAPNSFI